ncbi:MAG TPA: hypothetical protein VN914_09350, partial [Polyangia bacterium]|nr:hypothetical protein [Polyangia bacterium]
MGLTPDQVKYRIAENRRTNATSLDLSECGLEAVPEEVGELVWLEALALGRSGVRRKGNQWTWAGSSNSVSSNAIDEVTALRSLRRLQWLDLAD